MAKRPPLSMGTVKSKRFDFTLNDDDFKEHIRGFVPATTAADTQKCIKLFEDWKRERNSLFPADKVPEGVLLADKGQLCKWLCKFSIEARKKDGMHYPLKTIQHYLMSIQRHIHLHRGVRFNRLRRLIDCLPRIDSQSRGEMSNRLIAQ